MQLLLHTDSSIRLSVHYMCSRAQRSRRRIFPQTHGAVGWQVISFSSATSRLHFCLQPDLDWPNQAASDEGGATSKKRLTDALMTNSEACMHRRYASIVSDLWLYDAMKWKTMAQGRATGLGDERMSAACCGCGAALSRARKMLYSRRAIRAIEKICNKATYNLTNFRAWHNQLAG